MIQPAAPDWLEQHPDLAPREEMAQAAVRRATYDWGADDEDRPEPLVEYREDPVGFAVDVLGIPENTLRWSLNDGYESHEWDGTPDAIAEMLEATARGEHVGVESGTGTGKSFALAVLTLWFLACWEQSRVYTYAPTEDQLRLYMWAEINDLWAPFKRQFPTATITDLRIRMYGKSDKWSAHGYAVRIRAGEKSATAAQGAHAPHMLLITEETPGIEPSVMTALSETEMGGHNLQVSVGNPDHQADPLHRWCKKDYVTHIRASALDFPNVVTGEEVVKGAVTREKIQRRLSDYGPEDILFRSRSRGISPSEAPDALIKRSWLERAAARYLDAEVHERLAAKGKPALGVDVADSERGDYVAFAEWRGAVLTESMSFPIPDGGNALKLAYRVQTRQALIEADDWNVGIDNVGVGSNTINKGKELDHMWRGLNGGLTGSGLSKLDEELLEDRGKIVVDAAEFPNLRSQMWWLMRTDLMRDRIAIPPEQEAPKLWEDLLTPTWRRQKGRIAVEPKDKIRERLGRSPDEGDAAVMGNMVRDRKGEPEPEKDLSAWDPEVLEHEYDEGRRVRSKPDARTNVPPTATEWIP